MKPSLEIIWGEFSTQLDCFIRVRVSDHAAAEDILHDVFFKLQSRLEEFRDPTRLRAWLMLVARNAIIDYYRTRKPTDELTDSFADHPPGDGIEEQELKTVFHRLLLSLPEQYREALVLTEFEGLTQEQLARHLGISISGAKSRVQRARERLKELLLDYCHREFSRAVGSQPCPKGLLPAVDSRNGAHQNPSRRPPARPRAKTGKLRN